MRITIRLSDEAFRVAESVARQRRISLGDAVSQLILRPPAVPGLVPDSRAGLPLFVCDRTVTAADVVSLVR